jgi:hypothetical protein
MRSRKLQPHKIKNKWLTKFIRWVLVGWVMTFAGLQYTSTPAIDTKPVFETQSVWFVQNWLLQNMQFCQECFQGNCNVTGIECRMLMLLYDQTNGNSWNNSDNRFQNRDFDTRYGITTNNWHIQAIELSANNLQWVLQIANVGYNLWLIVPRLQRIDFSNNAIKGEIPWNLWEITTLQYLDLSRNQFEWDIPPEVGELEELQYLWLARNTLSQEVPDELAQLSNIEELYINHNQLYADENQNAYMTADVYEWYENIPQSTKDRSNQFCNNNAGCTTNYCNDAGMCIGTWGSQTTYAYRCDEDGDGLYGVKQECNGDGCIPDNNQCTDTEPTTLDCDDTDSLVNPDANEQCNQIDDNCNAEIDEWLWEMYYHDSDRDGFGNSEESRQLCGIIPIEYVWNDLDCDDTDASINPDATEVCDEVDNDCDGRIDDQDDSVTWVTLWYQDKDRDGFYGATWQQCSDPWISWVSEDQVAWQDCDDQNPHIYPKTIPHTCMMSDTNCNDILDWDEDICIDWWVEDIIQIDIGIEQKGIRGDRLYIYNGNNEYLVPRPDPVLICRDTQNRTTTMPMPQNTNRVLVAEFDQDMPLKNGDRIVCVILPPEWFEDVNLDNNKVSIDITCDDKNDNQLCDRHENFCEPGTYSTDWSCEQCPAWKVCPGWWEPQTCDDQNTEPNRNQSACVCKRWYINWSRTEWRLVCDDIDECQNPRSNRCRWATICENKEMSDEYQMGYTCECEDDAERVNDLLCE